MAGPTLTTEQIKAVEADRARQVSAQEAFLASAASQDAEIANLQIIDSAFKDFFDFFNDDIVGQYEAERQALNGDFQPNPVLEADILAAANLDPAGRLTPAAPDTDIIRIIEFDDGGLSNTSINETVHIARQLEIETFLQSGLQQTPSASAATTATSINSSSTSVDVTNILGGMSFSINDEFIIHDGGTDAAAVKVTSVTDNGGAPAGSNFTLGIQFIVEPAGTISSGATVVDSFSGFTNAERTTKTAINPNFQPLLDNAVTSLQSVMGDRQSRLAEQLTAIGTNQDPEGGSEFTTATSNINTSDTFITNYLATTDISDTGLASLASERAVRSPQITARVAEIVSAFTNRTQNYFDEKFNFANNRANTVRGSLRLQKNAEAVKQTALDFADIVGDLIAAYDSILS